MKYERNDVGASSIFRPNQGVYKSLLSQAPNNTDHVPDHLAQLDAHSPVYSSVHRRLDVVFVARFWMGTAERRSLRTDSAVVGNVCISLVQATLDQESRQWRLAVGKETAHTQVYHLGTILNRKVVTSSGPPYSVCP